MALNETLGASSNSVPPQDIGRCDYMKGDFEKEMYSVKAALHALGPGMIASRGERSPVYFGEIAGAVNFQIKKAHENGHVELLLNGESEMLPLSEVVSTVKQMLERLGTSDKE